MIFMQTALILMIWMKYNVYNGSVDCGIRKSVIVKCELFG